MLMSSEKQENVILVDEKDNEVGTEEKIKAHKNGGKLHRAFSVFIFNSKGEFMLQQRAESKYHCGGLWTNTCCSHPRPGEVTEEAAHRKLEQEMGFDTELKELFSFIYRAEFGNKLTEHELDHVFVGFYESEPKPNPEEAESWKWIGIKDLQGDIRKNPDKYTPWFKIALKRVLKYIKRD